MELIHRLRLGDDTPAPTPRPRRRTARAGLRQDPPGQATLSGRPGARRWPTKPHRARDRDSVAPEAPSAGPR